MTTSGRRAFVLSALLFAMGLGCSGDNSNTSVDETRLQIIEGCKHVTEGPAISLDATEASVTAPSIHARYELTLASEESAFSGTVNFDSMGGTHIFFSTEPATVSIKDEDGDGEGEEDDRRMPKARKRRMIGGCRR